MIDSAEYLGEALKINNFLKYIYLDFCMNMIEDDGVGQIQEALALNQVLEVVFLNFDGYISLEYIHYSSSK